MKNSFALVVMILFSLCAGANYAMDPQREPDPAFAKFFLARADGWFQKNVFDYKAKLSTIDNAFIAQFLKEAKSLGEMKDGIFLQTYSFNVYFDRDQTSYGPIRFIEANPTLAQNTALHKILSEHHIQQPKQSTIGIGFTSDPKEIEVITWEQGEVITRFRNGKQIAQTKIEKTTENKTCPAITVNALTNHVMPENRYAFRPSIFRDEALSMSGRRFIFKVGQGLQLEPGSIDYTDQMKYGLAYP